MKENMNHRQNIEYLKAAISVHEKAIANCSHEWGEARYDPEPIRVPYGHKNAGKGSDIWLEPEGYRDDTKDRWSRECKKCGKIEYAYTQEPVISGYKPKFF